MIFRPPDDASAPALIFLHERYGLTKHTLDLAQKAARAGFVGVAPDLFTRWQGDRHHFVHIRNARFPTAEPRIVPR